MSEERYVWFVYRETPDGPAYEAVFDNKKDCDGYLARSSPTLAQRPSHRAAKVMVFRVNDTRATHTGGWQVLLDERGREARADWAYGTNFSESHRPGETSYVSNYTGGFQVYGYGYTYHEARGYAMAAWKVARAQQLADAQKELEAM